MSKSIIQRLTLRQLTYLLALQEHQHFGRAAAACAVTQSTLSSALAELELILETQLVERSKRSLRFTAVGLVVAAHARDVIRSVEDLCEGLQSEREALVGTLRMAAIPTIAPFLLPRIVTAVGARWPRLRLFVREMLTSGACEALQRNTVDCVLLALPAECGDVAICEIMADQLLVAARPREGAALGEVSELTADPSRLLLLDEGHCLRDQALAACNLSNASSESPLIASTLQTLVQMVDAGLGVTFVPQMAVAAGILHGTRVTSRAIRPGVERRIALVWRKRSPRASDLQLLGATIRAAVIT
ncbi:hydrogen peroxide-inducible genes activator [Lichenifustis flavocetrariae]|uniref:Hydrogen peroxide-inducible genes activator n=1 Tax=Lichenifustis flavocetrariae TaxID=2949735 RepID=A0AA42CMZ4_9HYPH|nr:hydrogen peroxide-inducible genes activator [Lichenifustis flavocetrariae]MCW6508870.1 hydrogen peroxide-inducible genes activator [Lichenifustis flavocetrariae]